MSTKRCINEEYAVHISNGILGIHLKVKSIILKKHKLTWGIIIYKIKNSYIYIYKI